MDPVEYSPRFKWQNYDGGEGHRVPVFRANMEAMRNFSEYVESIESTGAHLQSGVVKVIPPTEWLDDLADKMRYHRLRDYKLPKILYGEIQVPKDSEPGVYNLENQLEHEAVPLSEYMQLASGAKRLPPHIPTIEEFEKYFWEKMKTADKNVEKVIYGADVEGSLFSNSVKDWNLDQLDSILNRLKDEKIDGVNSPYLYFGTGGSAFPFHVEDKDLYSINFHHMGEPKFWYAIPSHAASRFEALAAQLYPDFSWCCPQFIRHKICVVDPAVLEKYGIPYGKVAQYPGEFIITFPRGYHQGFNAGFNCAEAINFALPRWIHYGSVARICDCNEGMAVRLNMGNFYDLVKEQDVVSLRLPALDLRRRRPELVCESVKAQNAMERLRVAWSSFHNEQTQNRKMAMKAPYCSVCQPFSEHKLKTSEELPKSSTTLIHQKSFTKIEAKDRKLHSQLFNSPLRQCKHCGVCVHDFCYTGNTKSAAEFPPTASSPFEDELADDPETPKTSVKPKKQRWLCDRCRDQSERPDYRRKIICDFCSLRSGALIEHRRQLYRDGEAPESASTHTTYVHILCALMSRSTVVLRDQAKGQLIAHSLPPAREFAALSSGEDGFPLKTAKIKLHKRYVTRHRNLLAGHFNDRYCTLCDEQLIDVVVKCYDCNEEGRRCPPYHASCAALAGFRFRNADFPLVVTAQCPAHRNPEAFGAELRRSAKEEQRSELETEASTSKTPTAAKTATKPKPTATPKTTAKATKTPKTKTPKAAEPKAKAVAIKSEPKPKIQRKRPLPEANQPEESNQPEEKQRRAEDSDDLPSAIQLGEPQIEISTQPDPENPKIKVTLELPATTQFPVMIRLPDRLKEVPASQIPQPIGIAEAVEFLMPSSSSSPASAESANLQPLETFSGNPQPPDQSELWQPSTSIMDTVQPKPLLGDPNLDESLESTDTQPELSPANSIAEPKPELKPQLLEIPDIGHQQHSVDSTPKPDSDKKEFDFYSGFF